MGTTNSISWLRSFSCRSLDVGTPTWSRCFSSCMKTNDPRSGRYRTFSDHFTLDLWPPSTRFVSLRPLHIFRCRQEIKQRLNNIKETFTAVIIYVMTSIESIQRTCSWIWMLFYWITFFSFDHLYNFFGNICFFLSNIIFLFSIT